MKMNAQKGVASSAEVLDFSKLFLKQAELYGDRVCLDSVEQGTSATYKEVSCYCNKIANYFSRLGIIRGDVVSLIGRNSLETLLIYYGALNYGIVINPINVEESIKNVKGVLEYVDPKLLLYDSSVLLDEYGIETGLQIPFSEVGDVNQNGNAATTEFFSEVARESEEFTNDYSELDDFAEFAFTSGTTSFPKGAAITRRALYLMGLEVSERLGLSGSDVLLEYRNYNWLSSQTLMILPSLVAGSTLVLGRRFSRSRYPEWLKKKKITISAGVPTVINILVNDPVALHRDDVPDLRFITSSSAPLAVESQQAFENLYGIPIMQMAGMTEAGFMLGTPSAARKLGSAGPACRFKVVTFLDENHKPLPRGEVGEMVVSGESMALGYLQRDKTIKAFPAEGFHTGDLGYMDNDGYVFITGRLKDLIIKGGVNISPVEVTNRIIAHPAVKEAATIGIPDPIYGENIGAFVVLKDGPVITKQDIVEHCRETLASFKVPAQVHFVAGIPKTERGKVAKDSLLDLLSKVEHENPAGLDGRGH